MPPDSFYAGLENTVLGYGPAFRGLRAAWTGATRRPRRGRPWPTTTGRPPGYGVHPALLDGALQAMSIGGFLGRMGDGADETVPRLPFAWTGVTLLAAGATALRVRVAAAGEVGGVLPGGRRHRHPGHARRLADHAAGLR